MDPDSSTENLLSQLLGPSPSLLPRYVEKASVGETPVCEDAVGNSDAITTSSAAMNHVVFMSVTSPVVRRPQARGGTNDCLTAYERPTWMS